MSRFINKMYPAIVLVIALAACSEDPTGAEGRREKGEEIAGKPGGGTTPANPKIVFLTYRTIKVMDADGKSLTGIHTGTSGSYSDPSWSPDNSIVFSFSDGSSKNIKAIDVSVNGSGVPVGSNLRTIHSFTSSTQSIRHTDWSSTTSADRIAFSIRSSDASGYSNYLCVIDEDGSDLDTLYAFDNDALIEGISWNYDDSKIALFVNERTDLWRAVIICNSSTGEIEDSIALDAPEAEESAHPSNGGKFRNIDWSRGSSPNKVLLLGGKRLYYLTPSEGSSPSSYAIIANSYDWVYTRPTWSPDNDYVMWIRENYNGPQPTTYSLMRSVSQSTTKTTLIKNFETGYDLDWHR